MHDWVEQFGAIFHMRLLSAHVSWLQLNPDVFMQSLTDTVVAYRS